MSCFAKCVCVVVVPYRIEIMQRRLDTAEGAARHEEEKKQQPQEGRGRGGKEEKKKKRKKKKKKKKRAIRFVNLESI